MRGTRRGLFGVEEFPARMRPAADFDNLALGAGVDPVISAESIRLQVTLIILEELSRSVPFAAGGVVVYDLGMAGVADVHPEPSGPRVRQTGIQHLHGCVIGMDHPRSQHPPLHQLVERPN